MIELNNIYNGDCLEVLKSFPDNSVDSIVTDPPYGLSFMGKKWDYDIPSVDIWKECLRVLKPGGFLLSFAGTRTQHKICSAIEDAGFEIRDMVAWVYGSGFPKSLNVGKAVDKLQGNEREITGIGVSGGVETHTSSLNMSQVKNNNFGGEFEISKGTSEWGGWGTALKPALEPITVARKPLSEKSVANNVLKWGTGGINIDGCRIEHNEDLSTISNNHKLDTNNQGWGFKAVNRDNSGRFPANIILDEEAGKLLDEQSGISISKRCVIGSGIENIKDANIYGKYMDIKSERGHNDKGGASRFFYCAKASSKERNDGCEELESQERIRQELAGEHKNTFSKNNHPTVKPIKLIRYLVRLVTPKGGVCLDPFIGSGTTAIACIKERINYIGIEREEEYVKIALARIISANKEIIKNGYEE